MKIIELDLEKDDKLQSLSSLIKDKNIRVGEEIFQLKIHGYTDIYGDFYAAFLLLLVKYFFNEQIKNNKKSSADLSYYDKKSNMYYELYFKYNDVKKLENKIENDFKVDIEVEKKNTLNDVFGIWKNENIKLEQIREKAWQRSI
jgi:hypothetical protein